MFDTITSKDRPSAASQAAKTSKIIGINEYSSEGLMLKVKLQYFGHLM